MLRQDGLAEILMEDLQAPESSAGIPLEMQDRQRYFEGRMSGAAGMTGDVLKPKDPKVALQALKTGLQGWDTRLAEVCIPLG